MPRAFITPSLVIVGPTASGKSELAHALIERGANTGIWSADAMMIYREMDIGTAKPSAGEKKAARYIGLDLASPNESFSAVDFLAGSVRQAALFPGVRAWVLVGGTGLYIRAVLQGLDEAAGADTVWRGEADAILREQGFEALKSACRRRRPGIEQALPQGDRGNPRRWIRAAEREADLAVKTKRPMAAVRMIGIQRERDDLEQRIRRRVMSMYRDGLLEEASRLRGQYGALSPTAGQAIGYAEAFAVLDGAMSEAEAMERTVIRTRQYAKRQMTWFRNQWPVQWITVGADADVCGIINHMDVI